MPFTFDILEPGLALSGTPQTAADVLAPAFQAVLNVWDPRQPPYTIDLPDSVLVVRQAVEDGIPIPIAFLRRAVVELADMRRRGLWTLVHCQAGQSRSAAVVALYWMARDGATWDQALARMRLARPRVQPHPLLMDAATREKVVQAVRGFLDGDETTLEVSRAEAELLAVADRARGPVGTAAEWSFIETGLACGGAPVRAVELSHAGFTRLLNVAGYEARPRDAATVKGIEGAEFALPEASAADASLVAAAVRQLRVWRAEGQQVFVACSDGKSRSALIVALHFMVERGWDFPTAMWYIRKRQPGAWPRPQLLEGQSIEALCAECGN